MQRTNHTPRHASDGEQEKFVLLSHLRQRQENCGRRKVVNVTYLKYNMQRNKRGTLCKGCKGKQIHNEYKKIAS